jgi:hypothetical protein
MTHSYRPNYHFHVPSHHPQGKDGDVLVYSNYAKAICEMLANTTNANTGLTIGIFGDWGMGKSSVLQMVEDLITTPSMLNFSESTAFGNTISNYSPLLVKFNAWRYAHEEELWLALLRRVFNEIENKIGLFPLFKLNIALWWNRLNSSPVFWSSLFRIIAKSIAIGIVIILFLSVLNIVLVNESGKFIGTIAILMAGSALAFISSVFGHAWGAINAILSDKISISLPPLTLKGFDQGQAIRIDTFLTDLDAILDNFAKRQPIVVLIDDLDRCSPEQVVSILEAIKKFDIIPSIKTDVSREHKFAPIAFVLAADRRSIEFAVRAHFKDYLGEMTDENRRAFAREYIEKIVQVPFELPPLTSQKLSSFLELRINKEEGKGEVQ